ncbi:MAG: ribonuclease R [Christensenellaceae bacterium]|jgi:ribonuclease R|nr:ribonuclease R [Christensenellaceae bacterium]
MNKPKGKNERKGPESPANEPLRGRLRGNRRGFGFFAPEDGGEELRVPGEGLGGAMHGDLVLAKALPNGQARVLSVLERANERFVGVARRDGERLFVLPDEPRLGGPLLVTGGEEGPEEGEKLFVRITAFPDGHGKGLCGEIVERLGKSGETRVEILSIQRSYRLRAEFPAEVLAAAGKVRQTLAPGDILGREDLRGKAVVTIDGADARDFDDAISIERAETGWRLGVHIADVSHYVKKGGMLDREALLRGTSAYFPGEVLPMLPEALSNGICSLNPGVDRLTLSCEMEFDGEGELAGYRIFPSVIHSKARLVYEEVSRALEGGEITAKLRPLMKDLHLMLELYELLRKKRQRRGALDLDLAESEISLGQEGDVACIRMSERGVANRLIEEFMLAANETVAAHARKSGLPFLYRVHGEPDAEKLQAFAFFAESLGYPLHETTQKALQALLGRCQGKPESAPIASVLLRSLQKAKYDPRPLGHYGLAAKDYCHFTSPIRRYPDLFAHRALKAEIEGKKQALSKARGEALAEECSTAERRAMEAERAAEGYYKCLYMRGHIGEDFPGLITGVTNFGLFITLEGGIEGLLRLQSIRDDYYLHDPRRHCLIGERTRRIYRLGDPITVSVAGVDMATRRVELQPVQGEESRPKARSQPPRPGKKRGKPGTQGKRGAHPARRRKKK